MSAVWKEGWVLSGLSGMLGNPKRVQYRGTPGHYEIKVELLFGPIKWSGLIYPSLLNCLLGHRATLQEKLDRVNKRIEELKGED